MAGAAMFDFAGGETLMLRINLTGNSVWPKPVFTRKTSAADWMANPSPLVAVNRPVPVSTAYSMERMLDHDSFMSPSAAE
ncbi:MAG TPA: hypothetical protein VGI63_04310 [Verrucomicrobiae bacterium]